MKFKDIKHILARTDIYEILLHKYIQDKPKYYVCNYNNIDIFADLYNFNEAEIIYISASCPGNLVISLKRNKKK